MIEKQIKLIPYRVESTGYWESEIPQGVSMIHAPEAWEDNAGEDVVIAVIDSGVDVSHPDLKDAIIDGFNFTTDDSAAYQDENGHGTHVAGTIAAQQNNRGVVGVAPKAKLLVLKVLDKDGRKTLLHNMARLWNKKTAFHTAFLCAANKTGPGDTTIRNGIQCAKVIDKMLFLKKGKLG